MQTTTNAPIPTSEILPTNEISQQSTASPKIKLGIKDLVFLNLISIISLKQIPNVAPYGASSIVLWIIVALIWVICAVAL